MSGSTVVIGVGNPYRRDDAVGLEVVRRLRALGLSGVDLKESAGEPASLIEAWTGAELAVVVDAVRSGNDAGTLHRVVPVREGVSGWGWEQSAHAGAGSHALGMGHAVALGAALGRLPQQLVVLGVEAGDVGRGEGLSPQVAGAVDKVVAAIVIEAGLAAQAGT